MKHGSCLARCSFMTLASWTITFLFSFLGILSSWKMNVQLCHNPWEIKTIINTKKSGMKGYLGISCIKISEVSKNLAEAQHIWMKHGNWGHPVPSSPLNPISHSWPVGTEEEKWNIWFWLSKPNFPPLFQKKCIPWTQKSPPSPAPDIIQRPGRESQWKAGWLAEILGSWV